MRAIQERGKDEKRRWRDRGRFCLWRLGGRPVEEVVVLVVLVVAAGGGLVDWPEWWYLPIGGWVLY